MVCKKLSCFAQLLILILQGGAGNDAGRLSQGNFFNTKLKKYSLLNHWPFGWTLPTGSWKFECCSTLEEALFLVAFCWFLHLHVSTKTFGWVEGSYQKTTIHLVRQVHSIHKIKANNQDNFRTFQNYSLIRETLSRCPLWLNQNDPAAPGSETSPCMLGSLRKSFEEFPQRHAAAPMVRICVPRIYHMLWLLENIRTKKQLEVKQIWPRIQGRQSPRLPHLRS